MYNSLLIIHISLSIAGIICFSAASLKIIMGHEEGSNGEDIKGGIILDVGWVLYIFGIILGAVNANEIYGQYWVWNMKEIMTLLTSIAFLLYINLESRMNKNIRKIAIVLCLLLAYSSMFVPLSSLII